MSNDPQVFARNYADRVLEVTAPSLAYSTYRRTIKMDAPVFCGRDIEAAYLAGWKESKEMEDNGRDQAHND